MAAPDWLGFGSHTNWVSSDHVARLQSRTLPPRVGTPPPLPSRRKFPSAFTGGVKGLSESQALGCRFSRGADPRTPS